MGDSESQAVGNETMVREGREVKLIKREMSRVKAIFGHGSLNFLPIL